ncbi:MAG TPA: sensor histidine kinase [Chitinophagaceae bacterium]|nr:sensor histidine kinase [Chitinophagaceae bacterium]
MGTAYSFIRPTGTAWPAPGRLLLILVIILQGLATPCLAQAPPSTPFIDVNREFLADSITQESELAFLPVDSSLPEAYAHLAFLPASRWPGTLGSREVTRQAVLRFRVTNSGERARGIYFFPGFYYNAIDLYREIGGTLSPMAAALPPIEDSIGYRFLSVLPHDSAVVVVRLRMEKTYNNTIRPRLINASFLTAFVTQVHNSSRDLDLMTYLICGLLLMMALFSLATFLSAGNREFLYYFVYALLLSLMLFSKSFYNYRALTFSYFLESYLDFILQGVAIIFYLIFMRKFLVARVSHPFLYRLYNTGISVLLLALILNTYFHFLTNNFTLENDVENLTKFFLLLVMIPVFVFYGFRHWDDRLLRYLVWGNLAQLVFSLISLFFILTGVRFQSLPGILNSALFYYELSLLLELIFFLMGLTYKNRQQLIEQIKERERLKAENQVKEYEKELAVFKAQQEERDRISADMHDELGSGMTAIRLMSEIAKNKMKEQTPREIEKISQSANDVLNKMNAIIWSMNSGNDSVDNLIAYIREYALEYLEGTDIRCIIHTPPRIEPRVLSGDKRRNIFLCIKETLNNALKHSQATEIVLDITAGDRLIIRIADNGIGIDLDNLRQFGNGLQNIRRRMENIGGKAEIRRENGTLTILELPLG